MGHKLIKDGPHITGKFEILYTMQKYGLSVSISQKIKIGYYAN